MIPAIQEHGLYGHIDRLRGGFAICVMLGHAIDCVYGVGAPDYSFQVLMSLRPMLGFVWVVGFIVLSGYCVTRSCLRARTQSIGGFLALRASRLFPLLWVAVALAVSIEAMVAGSPHRPSVWTGGIDRSHAILNLFGLGGFYGQYGALAPAYTLSYELVFYVLWAAAWFGARRRSATALLACAVLSVVLYSARGLQPAALRTILNDFMLLLFQCWCIGAALAVWLPQLAASRPAGLLAAFRWPLLIAIIWVGFSAYRMPSLEATRVTVLYYPILALAFALLTVGFVARMPATPSVALDRWLGALSYPLFVTHGPVIVGLSTLYRTKGMTLDFGPYVLALAIPALAVGWVFAALIDAPVLAVRQRWRSRPTVSAAAAPESV